jgi:hypothetical protein
VATKLKKIDEYVVEDKRLGRHIEHDSRSRGFAFQPEAGAIYNFNALKSVVHRRWGEVYDQGDLGSCTGNAIAGACNTRPTHVPGAHLLHEGDAVELYGLATQLDEWDGTYPPEDTGSSGLAACKAAVQKGYITRYEHSFDIKQAIMALQERPVITGINWYEGFDEPDNDGMVALTGQLRGGHEVEVVGFHVTANALSVLECVIELENSWSRSWGVRGRFYMLVRTWADLLEDEGDVTVPIR